MAETLIERLTDDTRAHQPPANLRDRHAAAAEIERLSAELERLEFALAYLTSCTAATAERLADRKSASKYEKSRHYALLGHLIDALQGKHIGSRFSSFSIAGCLQHAERACQALAAK